MTDKKKCDQCKETEGLEDVALVEGIYRFNGLLCPKHAAEWRDHFEKITAEYRARRAEGREL